jgi:hypothetical protein
MLRAPLAKATSDASDGRAALDHQDPRVRGYIHRDRQGLRVHDYIRHPDCSHQDSAVRQDHASKADPDAPDLYI